MLLSAMTIVIACCTACATQQPAVSASVAAVSPGSIPEAYTPLSTDNILPVPDAAVLACGKELLKEYDVQYNQVIRFPIDGLVYETKGAYALTTIEEAHSMYPNLSIPDFSPQKRN